MQYLLNEHGTFFEYFSMTHTSITGYYHCGFGNILFIRQDLNVQGLVAVLEYLV